MLADVVVPLLSALLGGVVVAVLNYLLSRKKTEAEIDKLKAETDKIRAETEMTRLGMEDVRSGQLRQEDGLKQVQAFLVRHFVTRTEREHLERLATKAYWPFQHDDTTTFFLDELRNLRSLGLIEGQPGKGIRSLTREGGDINSHFRITPDGEAYLRMLRQSQES